MLREVARSAAGRQRLIPVKTNALRGSARHAAAQGKHLLRQIPQAGEDEI